ncbi:putative calcium-binding protein [Ananas comosus]|uniref:Putative calcium-binding protein n=1 Tax=Ananas comosus TaxID=4615 RepID=A0A199VBB5_ANACO|nr:putative calcium-binding protein [Ananas comosus]
MATSNAKVGSTSDELPTSQRIDDLERIFAWFDVDGDGKLSAAELRLMMNAVEAELSIEDAEAVVRSADSDGDGLLDLNEFVKLAELEGAEEGKELREAFGMYEMEGKGYITAASLKQMLSRLGASAELKECMSMIKKFDLNGDGVLSFDEFRIMMKL